MRRHRRARRHGGAGGAGREAQLSSGSSPVPKICPPATPTGPAISSRLTTASTSRSLTPMRRAAWCSRMPSPMRAAISRPRPSSIWRRSPAPAAWRSATTRRGFGAARTNFKNRVLAAAKTAGENIWLMPIFEGHENQIRSDVALIKNSGGRLGGACTAGGVPQDVCRGYAMGASGHRLYRASGERPLGFGAGRDGLRHSDAGRTRRELEVTRRLLRGDGFRFGMRKEKS